MTSRDPAAINHLADAFLPMDELGVAKIEPRRRAVDAWVLPSRRLPTRRSA